MNVETMMPASADGGTEVLYKLGLYDYARLAKVTGIDTRTLVVYLNRARELRRAGKGTAAHLPDPDMRFGTSPCWREDTIRGWLKARETSPMTMIRLDADETLRLQEPVLYNDTEASI